jgi:hypothetical protein
MRQLIVAFLCLGLASHLGAKEKDKEKSKGKEGKAHYVSLFDGKTLAGWKGRKELWTVRDGVIVGSTKPKGNDFNTFLIADKEYADFVLKLQFKFTGGNSGVQFRSRQIGDPEKFVVSGYQADIGDGYTGAIYDEARRGKILAKPEEEVFKKAYKPNDWNDYEIHAKGKRIEIRLNGISTVKYEEADKEIAPKGIIALQLHAGGPMEVLFRDLKLKELHTSEK